MFLFTYYAIQQARGIYGDRIAEVAGKQLDMSFIEMCFEITLFAIVMAGGVS